MDFYLRNLKEAAFGRRANMELHPAKMREILERFESSLGRKLQAGVDWHVTPDQRGDDWVFYFLLEKKGSNDVMIGVESLWTGNHTTYGFNEENLDELDSLLFVPDSMKSEVRRRLGA
jgi:hypothetical protein